MKNQAKANIAREHERATWSVYLDHLTKCAQCRQAYISRHKDPGARGCLEGEASRDEWRIAALNLRESLGDRYYQYGKKSDADREGAR